jgi:hypothetical protein
MHQLQTFIDELHGRSTGDGGGSSVNMPALIICLVAVIVIVGSPIISAVLGAPVFAICHAGAAMIALALLMTSRSGR